MNEEAMLGCSTMSAVSLSMEAVVHPQEAVLRPCQAEQPSHPPLGRGESLQAESDGLEEHHCN